MSPIVGSWCNCCSCISAAYMYNAYYKFYMIPSPFYIIIVLFICKYLFSCQAMKDTAEYITAFLLLDATSRWRSLVSCWSPIWWVQYNNTLLYPVIPRFEVDLEGPKHVLREDDDIRGVVSARYILSFFLIHLTASLTFPFLSLFTLPSAHSYPSSHQIHLRRKRAGHCED